MDGRSGSRFWIVSCCFSVEFIWDSCGGEIVFLYDVIFMVEMNVVEVGDVRGDLNVIRCCKFMSFKFSGSTFASFEFSSFKFWCSKFSRSKF